jgi:TRAP-type C4-dicarboxylate transport system permease small subunit
MFTRTNKSGRAKIGFGGWLGLLGHKFQKSVRMSALVFAVITSLAVVVMAMMGGADVFGTKVFNSPVPGTLEVTETLMVVLVFGGLAYAQVQRRHIKVEFLTRFLPAKAQIILELLGILVADVFFFLLTWRCYLYFLRSWFEREAGPSIIGFPIYPSKFFMLLGSVLMTLQLLVDTFCQARALWQAFSGLNHTKGINQMRSPLA